MANENKKIEILKDKEGNRIVFIYDPIFKGKKRIDWNEIEKYLRKYVGKFYEIAETQEVVYIGADLPDEYAHSDYTRKLLRQHAKAKANAIQAIPELIVTSGNPKYSENKKEKHKNDAKQGWYKYSSKIAIPVYNETNIIEKFNIFGVGMLIRKASNGKMYLYDIIDIKKETDILFLSIKDFTQ